MILSEFDPNKNAIINPNDIVDRIENFPEIVVSCFSRTTFQRMVDTYKGEEITRTSIANMEIPIYEITYKDKNIALFNSYVGSAGCVAILEDVYAMGMKKLVLFGTCGILDHEIDDTSIVIPHTAVRDEGTSYHYMPASDEIEVNKDTREKLVDFLKRKNISYTSGKIWTTDAIYRETIDKTYRRRDSGCIAVDMECSAVAAWTKFRNISTTHFFYAADHLSKEGWNIRSLSGKEKVEEKDMISELAISYASEL